MECKYGKENCWFNHTTEELFNENKNDNIIEIIFKIMENITECTVDMEKDNNKIMKQKMTKTKSKDKLNCEDEKKFYIHET